VLDDPDAAGRKAIPRLTGFFKPGAAPRMFALVDPDGTLLRVIDNGDAAGRDDR
jgi:hypothetical protein